jgi:hypothetical protein
MGFDIKDAFDKLRRDGASKFQLSSGIYLFRVFSPVHARRGDRRRVRGYRLRDEWACTNGITTVGLNKLLDTGIRNQTQIATWYVGLINNTSFSAVSAADTMSSHAGWVEHTAYNEAVRQTLTAANAASNGTLTASAACSFTINANGNIRGGFLTSDNAKSGTAGTLYSTSDLGSARAVTNTEVLQAYYQTNLTAVS